MIHKSFFNDHQTIRRVPSAENICRCESSLTLILSQLTFFYGGNEPYLHLLTYVDQVKEKDKERSPACCSMCILWYDQSKLGKDSRAVLIALYWYASCATMHHAFMRLTRVYLILFSFSYLSILPGLSVNSKVSSMWYQIMHHLDKFSTMHGAQHRTFVWCVDPRTKTAGAEALYRVQRL